MANLKYTIVCLVFLLGVKRTPANLLRNFNIPTKLVAKCPTNPPSPEFPPGPDQECQNDASCDTKFPGKDLKCCSDGCDFRCIPPIVESVVDGKCPLSLRPDPGECPSEIQPGVEECTTDQECYQSNPGVLTKCCREGCYRRCMQPVSPVTGYVVPGTCPLFPTPAECPPEPDNECNNDQKCKELIPGIGLKCCLDGCDLRCLPPIAPPDRN